jgi:mannose-6-phosphate isomerase
MAALGAEILGIEVPARHSAQSSSAALCPEFPLLLKLIFPREKLSVQVHPDDVLAQSLGHPRGKTECWYVLDAAPGATIALGLRPGVTQDDIRRAIADNTIESLLNQVPVAQGDMLFVDAGTIHAIGPGIVLFETQQQSDLTYRLYDYDRGRELHLDLGLRALRLATAAGKIPPNPLTPGDTRLIAQEFFTVDRIDLAARGSHAISPAHTVQVLIPLTEGVALHSSSAPALPLPKAHAVVIPANATGFELIASAEAVVLRAIPGIAA